MAHLEKDIGDIVIWPFILRLGRIYVFITATVRTQIEEKCTRTLQWRCSDRAQVLTGGKVRCGCIL